MSKQTNHNHNYGTFKDSLREPIYNWFAYPAGYSYKLVNEKIKEHKLDSKSWILDPFVGSGTTSIAAKLAGVNSIGVEAVVELSPDNEDHIGIEAKWFSNGSISGGYKGRRSQIIDSLDKAKKRKGLKKWILSSPINFDDEGATWWKEQQQKNSGIKLEFWDKDRLSELLREPRNFGLTSWFFGDLEFNAEWFKKEVTSKIELVSQKFKPSG